MLPLFFPLSWNRDKAVVLPIFDCELKSLKPINGMNQDHNFKVKQAEYDIVKKYKFLPISN